MIISLQVTGPDSAEEADLPGDAVFPVPLLDRTPEETILFALQGLLAAREAHIARLEV